MDVSAPICVFDSGVGGLSVVAELWRMLPGEEIVYFGDTARVPYGSKSPETITRFTREIISFLGRFNPKIIVAACNTVSAVAQEALSTRDGPSIVDVVLPGARAAVEYSRSGRIGVVATEATVNSGAYSRAICGLSPGARVIEVAAPIVVPMVEEGRRHGSPIVRAVLWEYLKPVQEFGADVLVLGCTHYPVFKPAFQAVMGDDVYLVDSAEQTAMAVSGILRDGGMVRAVSEEPGHRFFVSDNPDRFGRIGSLFLLRRDIEVILVPPSDFPGGADASRAGQRDPGA